MAALAEAAAAMPLLPCQIPRVPCRSGPCFVQDKRGTPEPDGRERFLNPWIESLSAEHPWFFHRRSISATSLPGNDPQVLRKKIFPVFSAVAADSAAAAAAVVVVVAVVAVAAAAAKGIEGKKHHSLFDS